jgi:hypothetical protein
MHHGIAVRRVVFFALIVPCIACPRRGWRRVVGPGLLMLLAATSGCDAVLGLGKFTFDAGDECTGPSFDPARITPFLASDGGLPPLPPFEAGPDVGPDATDAGGG